MYVDLSVGFENPQIIKCLGYNILILDPFWFNGHFSLILSYVHPSESNFRSFEEWEDLVVFGEI